MEYEPSDCTHVGNCNGTCPKCDTELTDIQEQLEKKNITDITSDEKLCTLIKQYADESQEDVPEESSMDDIESKPLLGMPSAKEDETSTELEEKLLLECMVAGTKYHLNDAVFNLLRVGEKLYLARDYYNEHDKNAVAVTFNDFSQEDPENFDSANVLGYIPKDKNWILATLLDMGWDKILSTTISELHPDSDYEKIRITIHVRPKSIIMAEEEKQSRDLVRMVYVNDMEDFEYQLYENGYVLFNWGGPRAHSLPRKGERVFFYCQESDLFDDMYRIYLMKLAATGTECESYVEYKYEIETHSDDIYPFIFTNIKGPFTIEGKQLDYYLKKNEDKLKVQAGEMIPKKYCEKLLDIFENS